MHGLFSENYPECRSSETEIHHLDVYRCDSASDFVNSSCTFAFSGNVDPVVIWQKHTGSIITVEDNVRIGGFGSAVSEFLTQSAHSKTRLYIHGIPDEFIEQGTQEELYRSIDLDPLGIARTITKFLGATVQATIDKFV